MELERTPFDLRNLLQSLWSLEVNIAMLPSLSLRKLVSQKILAPMVEHFVSEFSIERTSLNVPRRKDMLEG